MKITLTILSIFLAGNLLANSAPKVIYGEDNRQDAVHYHDALFQEYSRSTAAMMSKRWFQEEGEFLNLYRAKDMVRTHSVCEDEPFAKQIVAATCTGFLVAEDVLVTAGHCMEDVDKCPDYYWVFDFKSDEKGVVDRNFSKDKVYNCQKVLEIKRNVQTKEDYAVIKLDRKVQDRLPLKFRKAGKIATKSPLTLMGYPSGLPLKIAGEGQIRNNENENSFLTTVDAYGGNSGSPVFNSLTGEVEGVLSGGESDWVLVGQDDDEWTLDSGCYQSRKCQTDECLGETVTRITIINYLK